MTDPAPDLAGLGGFVRARRHALGLTQRELGTRIGWVQERVSLLERGGYGLPSLIILARLATALESPLTHVLAALGYQDVSPAVERESSHCAALLYALEGFLALPGLTLDSVLPGACDVAARAMGADIVDLYLYDEASQQLVSSGCSTTPLAREVRELGLNRLPVDQDGRIVEVFTSGLPYFTGAAQKDVRVKIYTDLGIESLLVAPITIAGTRIGVLVAGSRHVDRFSEEERHFFLAVSHWLGLVAHRARLLEEQRPEHTP